MNTDQQRSILTIALFAAFADGTKDEHERQSIRDIATSLTDNNGPIDVTKLYQDVLLKRTNLSAAAAPLIELEHRQLAYEMAVCVCDADGRQTETEKTFLNNLRQLLSLDQKQLGEDVTQADALAEYVDTDKSAKLTPTIATSLPSTVTSETTTKEPVTTSSLTRVNEADLDKSILKYATLNGALELLPQSWASLAIIPLQIKMVYRIGKAYGVELDSGHIKEFIAAAGVGLTSQYLEQIGRKLLGGLLGKMAGKALGSLGNTATGMAFSFASTYALGQVAKRYYAGGRQMSTTILRDTFQQLLGPAKQLQTQNMAQIQQTASGLDAAKVMALVRE